MQTFLPSGSSLFSAQILDSKRLNKQILEGYQILKVLATNGKAWRNHPAVLMWEGHEGALLNYVHNMITEAKHRGIKTVNNEANINALAAQYNTQWDNSKPDWMLDKVKLSRVVATHRANLYRKDPIYYAEYSYAVDNEYNKPCCTKCQYFWPTHPRKKK
jgi:Pyrimidine dimer DNA glycosylase